MSNCPHRSVSASDQRAICLFGVNPAVESEWIVSDISGNRFEIKTLLLAAVRHFRPREANSPRFEALASCSSRRPLDTILRLSCSAVKGNITAHIALRVAIAAPQQE